MNGGDSPKGSSRLRVSSALKYAFAWGVQRWPPNYDRGSALQRIQPGQTGLPTRTRRALQQDGIPLRPSAAGYSACWVPPFASDPWAGTWRSGVPALLPRGESERSSGAVEDRVRQRGNAVNHRHGRAEVNGSGQNSQPAIARWVAPYRVGFIPALKGGAFSLNFRNCLCFVEDCLIVEVGFVSVVSPKREVSFWLARNGNIRVLRFNKNRSSRRLNGVAEGRL